MFFLIFFPILIVHRMYQQKKMISIDIGTNNQNIDENKQLVIERQKTPYYTSTHSIRLASHKSISGESLKCQSLLIYLLLNDIFP